MGLLPKDADILPPSDDRIFKLIMASPEGKPALMDLVSAVIGRPVVDAVVRNSEIPPEDTGEKAERLDVNCGIDDGSQIDLEMQASRIEEEDDSTDNGFQNLKGKGIYYLCDLHSSQPSRGIRRYDRLARTYQVTFCSYTVFPEREGFFNTFSLRHDKDNGLLSDAIHVVYVELSKLKGILKKPVKEMTDIEKWAVFFRYANKRRYRDTVNEVIQSKEAMEMAGSLLMSVSQDEKERAVFRSRKMYQTDMQSNWNTAYDKGEKQGRIKGKQEGLKEGKREGLKEGMREGEKKGEKKGKREVAINALEMNIPVGDVARMTGLSIEELNKIESGDRGR